MSSLNGPTSSSPPGVSRVWPVRSPRPIAASSCGDQMEAATRSGTAAPVIRRVQSAMLSAYSKSTMPVIPRAAAATQASCTHWSVNSTEAVGSWAMAWMHSSSRSSPVGWSPRPDQGESGRVEPGGVQIHADQQGGAVRDEGVEQVLVGRVRPQSVAEAVADHRLARSAGWRPARRPRPRPPAPNRRRTRRAGGAGPPTGPCGRVSPTAPAAAYGRRGRGSARRRAVIRPPGRRP